MGLPSISIGRLLFPLPEGATLIAAADCTPGSLDRRSTTSVDEVPARLRLRIRCAQERGPYQQDAVSVVTLGSVQETVRADGAQGRGNEKRERQSDLRHDQGAAEALPSCRRPATAVLQGTGNLGRDACSAGTTPKITAAANASSAVNTKSRALMPIVRPSRHEADDAGRHRDPDRVAAAIDTASASGMATHASSVLSLRSGARGGRAWRRAPGGPQIAVLRSAPRASSRFAMLAQRDEEHECR